jgi:hypothetical protein
MATSTAIGGPVPMARGWRRWLRQSYDQADFAVRGFPGGPARPRLEAAAKTFLGGFNEALAAPAGAPPDFRDRPDDLRGFAVEGAAMQAALLDLLTPGGGRLAALLRAHEERYVYLIHVGAGWAMAKLRYPRPLRATRTDPLLRWLAYDGWGFSAGFFATPRGLDRIAAHRRCTPVCAIRHQGLGRSLWFRACGEPDTVAGLVARLPVAHHGDAWAGVGLAAGYGCGTGPEAADRLRELAGPAYRADLGQGAAFAAGAWRRAGAIPAGPAAVLERLTRTAPETAAGWAFATTSGLEHPDAGPAEYAEWRRRIRARLPV